MTRWMTAAMLAIVMGTAAGCAMSDGKMTKSDDGMMKKDDGMMKKEGTMEKK
jgi:hypothetical protein